MDKILYGFKLIAKFWIPEGKEKWISLSVLSLSGEKFLDWAFGEKNEN